MNQKEFNQFHKTNLALLRERRQLNENINIQEIKEKYKTKCNNASRRIISKSINNSFYKLKFKINIKNDQLKIDNEKSSILHKRILEEKNNLKSLNKCIKNFNIQKNNNYYNNNYNYKNKNHLKINLNLNKINYNLNHKKKIKFEYNSGFTIDTFGRVINNNKQKKENDLRKNKLNKLKKIKDKKKFIKMINECNNKTKIYRNKNALNDYITVNKLKNQNTLFNTINNNTSNNKFINFQPININSNYKCENITEPNIENKNIMKTNLNISYNQNMNNNDNSINEKINNFKNNEGDVNIIRINKINENNDKENISSTINYSPDKFYHNIINYKRSNHYINIKNYNDFKNEKIFDNNKKYMTQREKYENKSKNLYKKKIKYYCKENNKDNYYKTEENIENNKFNNKSNISSKCFQRNTFSYIEENKKDENKVFTINELFSRDKFLKNLSFQCFDYQPKTTINPSIENNTKKYSFKNDEIIQKNEEDNNHSIYKRIKIPINNNSKQNYQMNNENKKNKILFNNNTINYNIDFLENIYENNNKENIDTYNYSSNLYNICIPKTNQKDCLKNDNIFLSNLKEVESTLSSKGSCCKYKTNTKSKINIVNRKKKNFSKSILNSSKRKLSDSFNKEYMENKTEVKYKIPKSSNSIIIKKNNQSIHDNFCYIKKNNVVLNDRKIIKLRENNSMKYKYNIQNLNTKEGYLTSRPLGKMKTKSDEFICTHIETEKNISTEKRLYIKPIQINSISNYSTNNKLIKENYDKKRYSQNLILSNINLNNFNETNTKEDSKTYNIKKSIYLRNYLIHNSNTTINKSKYKNEEEKINNTENNNIKENISFDKITKIQSYKNINIDKIDNFDFCVIDRKSNHCYYKKICNYFLKMPIKKICYIEKIKKNFIKKNAGFVSFNELINKDKETEEKFITFNGKDIISEIDNVKENLKLKINGCNEYINLELNEENKIIPKFNRNIINANTNEFIKNEKKINKNNQFNIDNNLIDLIDNDDISKKIKICLATNKLNNILVSKNDYMNSPKRRSITEEKFALGCSKLNKIFLKKSTLKNLNLNNIQNIKTENNIEEINISDNNLEEIDNKLKIKKKTYTYNSRQINTMLNDEEFNAIQNNIDDKNKEIESKILDLLNILNINNLNIISKKLSDIILYYDNSSIYLSETEIGKKYIENENIFINIILDKLSNEKCNLSLYTKLFKEINILLLKIIKKKSYITDENNIFDKIIKEYIKRIKDKEYFNVINEVNENQLNYNKNKFFCLINFFSELILSKLINKMEIFNLVNELYNESERFGNGIKFIYIKGCIDLFNSLLEIIIDYKINYEDLIELENIIENKFKKIIYNKNIPDNLKNNISNIIDKFKELKEYKNKSINKDINNNLVFINNNNKRENNFDRTKKEKIIINDKDIHLNINKINEIKNNDINDNYQEENGGKDNINNNTKIFVNTLNNEKRIKSRNINNKIEDKNKYNDTEIYNDDNFKSFNNINWLSRGIRTINDNINNNGDDLDDNNKTNKENEMNNSNITFKNNSKIKKKSKSTDKTLKIKNVIKDEVIYYGNDNKIYNQILKNFDNYFEYLKKERINSKKDFYPELNDSYNWNTIDDLIMSKNVKLEEIIKIYIQICQNKNDLNKNDLFKAYEYIKTIIEYYMINLSNNQINIFHLNMIEIFMNINNIVKNDNKEIMHEIMGNLLFILLKNKLYYIKDLNNFIDKSEETKINIAKAVKYAIIASGTYSKQYHNDFKYTKLFNNSNLFIIYVTNKLGDINKK